MNTLVSIIIPCYNQAQFLPDALKSVKAQTYHQWECIIVNDGSHDHTETVALEWVAEDKRFTYISKENGGLSSARNRGLQAATGRYIQFLDADDVINENKLSIQIKQLTGASNLALSYCDYFPSTESNLKELYTSWYLNPKFKTNQFLSELIADWETKLSIPCNCFLFDRRFFTDHSILFDETLTSHEDWYCWVNILALEPKVFYIDQKLATYRIRSHSMARDAHLMKNGYLCAINKLMGKYKDNITMFNLLEKKYEQVDSFYGKIEHNVSGIDKLMLNAKKKLKRLLQIHFR